MTMEGIMQGTDMKQLLSEADGAFVELKVTSLKKARDGREYRTVKEIVKLEPNVPF